jgi:predicted solute-binding protein
MDAFHRAHERGRQAIPDLAKKAGATWDLPASVCADYLSRECVYNLGSDMGLALEAFGERAAALDLADPRVMPTPTGH